MYAIIESGGKQYKIEEGRKSNWKRSRPLKVKRYG